MSIFLYQRCFSNLFNIRLRFLQMGQSRTRKLPKRIAAVTMMIVLKKVTRIHQRRNLKTKNLWRRQRRCKIIWCQSCWYIINIISDYSMSTLLKYLYIPVKIIWWQPYWYIFIYHSLGEERGGGTLVWVFYYKEKRKRLTHKLYIELFTWFPKTCLPFTTCAIFIGNLRDS